MTSMCGSPGGPSCDEVLEQLYVFIDNELDPIDAAQVKGHLDDCEGCSAEQRVETVVKMLVQKGCREQAPEGLRERVMVSIRQVTITQSE